MSSGIYSTRPAGRKDGPRDILRNQDKLRAQQELGARRLRKLKQSETYDAAPPGYVFMPLGTPELADRCKDLSQQQGYPIHVVNAKPSSKVVLDPSKISHHVQRIGYHFKDSVVEEACTQLHYMISEGKFVSEADLRQHSFVAKVMAKHGLQATKLTQQESPEQLRAAIRELFPAIPSADLDEVVKHAWDQKESRVGTAAGMDLSRRIQLAVLARIRHTYTDYDILLKTFDWVQCRREVEPVCLKKLLEWRGETASDDGLEEIIAETMLLDEQSDAPRSRARRSNRRTSGYDTGEASDASIEVSHHVAIDDDLRPESPQERFNGYFAGQRAPIQSYAQRHDIARAKIQAARAQMQYYPPPSQPEYVQYPPAQQMERIHVSTDRSGHAPSQIIVGGKVLRRASPEPAHQGRQLLAPASYRPIHGAPALVQQAPQPSYVPQQSMPSQSTPSYLAPLQTIPQQSMPHPGLQQGYPMPVPPSTQAQAIQYWPQQQSQQPYQQHPTHHRLYNQQQPPPPPQQQQHQLTPYPAPHQATPYQTPLYPPQQQVTQPPNYGYYTRG